MKILEEEIRLGKYTRWAVGLTGEKLLGLLWLVGEIGVRRTLSRNRGRPRGDAARYERALELLIGFHDEPLDVESVREEMRQARPKRSGEDLHAKLEALEKENREMRKELQVQFSLPRDFELRGKYRELKEENRKLCDEIVSILETPGHELAAQADEYRQAAVANQLKAKKWKERAKRWKARFRSAEAELRMHR